MDLRCTTKTSVFSDWLDVTCSPDDSFIDSVSYALDSIGGHVISYDRDVVYSLGNGTVKLQRNKCFHKVGVSGSALFRIRELGKLDYFLSCLGEVPHSVTRLDVSLDALQDGADVFAHFQKRFSKPSKYPKLSRKAVVPSYFSSRRESDGRVTGTVNIGAYKNTKVSARIYDKQHEALQKRGEILPPTVRYELTVRKDMQPSLRDVVQPTGIFWHYMGNTLLTLPDDAPSWEPGWGGAWKMQVEKPLLYQVVKSKVETNPELQRIFELADSMCPDGREIVFRMIKESYVGRQKLVSGS